MSNTLDNYRSQAEASRQLKISRAAVSNLIARGVLTAHDVAGRKVLTQAEIDRYKHERRTPGWAGYHDNLRKSLKKKNNTK